MPYRPVRVTIKKCPICNRPVNSPYCRCKTPPIMYTCGLCGKTTTKILTG
jgi:hypothetical protein